MDDQNQRIELIRDLLQYYHKPANNTVLSVWLKHCYPMDDQEFRTAIEICLMEREHLPTIAEFLELTRGDSEALDQLSLEQAWQLIIEGSAIATSRSDEHIHRRRQIQTMLSDAQRKALGAVGGLIGLGFTPADQLHWRKRDFIASYRIHKEGEKAIQRSQLYLTGDSIPDSLKPYEGEEGDRDDGMDDDQSGLDEVFTGIIGDMVPDSANTGLGSIRDILGNFKRGEK